MQVRHPRLLVGAETADDAGVWKISDQLAIVQTADIVTPMTDDAYLFGQVAAANALSDVYAMGGVPLTAVNLAFFPSTSVPPEVLRQILRGALEKVQEAGAVVVGGHTLKDDDLKFGLCVIGTCDPSNYLPNSRARVGDQLVLTKPLGTGVTIDATRRGWIAEPRPVLEAMATLNDVASRLALQHGAHSATDVTGFGLAGHTMEMVKASGVRIRLWLDAVPRYPACLDLIERGAKTGLTADNRESTKDDLTVDDAISPTHEALIYDPQTSGGLLVCLPASAAPGYLDALLQTGVEQAAIIGEVIEGQPPHLDVIATCGR